MSMIQARTEGEVRIKGKDIIEFNPSKESVNQAIVTQNNILWYNLTVDEHLDVVC